MALAYFEATCRLVWRRAVRGAHVDRVFFCIVGQTMVLLHGFMKKTQKTPIKEVDLARARQKEIEK